MTLQPGVLIETCASVEGASIGAYTIIEAGAKIGKGAVVGANSKVCAGVEIGEGMIVEACVFGIVLIALHLGPQS